MNNKQIARLLKSYIDATTKPKVEVDFIGSYAYNVTDGKELKKKLEFLIRRLEERVNEGRI